MINEEGIPTQGTKNISFGYIASIIRRDGSLTKIAKIIIFQTYMRSQIVETIKTQYKNHMNPVTTTRKLKI